MLDMMIKGLSTLQTLEYRAMKLLHSSTDVPYALARAFGAYVVEEAQHEIGTYQTGIDRYPPWAPLSEETMRKRQYGDHNPNEEPLLDTGAMLESLDYEPLGFAVGNTFSFVVGYKVTLDTVTNSSDGMGAYPKWHEEEYGTANMPPRPVLGPAALRAAERDDMKGQVYHIVLTHLQHPVKIYGGIAGIEGP
jgi:hypothetical protein